jgi:negative regulator of flagellin synthesis FlgM
MHIHGTTHVHGPQGINAPHTVHRTPAAQGPRLANIDSVEISPAAAAASQATESGQIRTGLVNDIRAQIAAGTYDTPEKLDIAMERLLDEIG